MPFRRGRPPDLLRDRPEPGDVRRRRLERGQFGEEGADPVGDGGEAAGARQVRADRRPASGRILRGPSIAPAGLPVAQGRAPGGERGQLGPTLADLRGEATRPGLLSLPLRVGGAFPGSDPADQLDHRPVHATQPVVPGEQVVGLLGQQEGDGPAGFGVAVGDEAERIGEPPMTSGSSSGSLGLLLQALRRRHEATQQVAAVDRRDVGRRERQERPRVVPVVEVAPVRLQAVERVEGLLEPLDRRGARCSRGRGRRASRGGAAPGWSARSGARSCRRGTPGSCRGGASGPRRPRRSRRSARSSGRPSGARPARRPSRGRRRRAWAC